MKKLSLLFVLFLAFGFSNTTFAQGNEKEKNKAKKEFKKDKQSKDDNQGKEYDDDDGRRDRSIFGDRDRDNGDYKKGKKGKKMKKGKKKGGPSIEKRIRAEERSNGNAYKGSRHNIYDTEDSDAVRKRKIRRARKGDNNDDDVGIFGKKKKKDGGIFG